MLLSETLRNLSLEEVLEYDETYYQSSTAAHNWTTRATKNISLPAERIILIHMEARQFNGTGGARILIDSSIKLSCGANQDAGDAIWNRTWWIRLAAGSHSLAFQTFLASGGTGTYIRVQKIIIATLPFPDFSHGWNTGSQSVANNGTVTVVDQNYTAPATRKTPLGNIKQYAVFIYVNLSHEERFNEPRNADAGSDLADYMNWRIEIDNVRKDWLSVAQTYPLGSSRDNRTGWTDQPTYGVGSTGRYAFAINAGASFNLKIKATNKRGATKTAAAEVAILFCPWIMPASEFEPLSMSFPQGSTAYVVTEPLAIDTTQSLKIGKVRAMSFGDATDYYYTSSGTGILASSYTFESVEVDKCLVKISGYGGCISIIGVDVR